MAEGTALIIEDSQTQANIIGRMLAGEDWSCVVAKTLPDAHRLLLELRPKLVFVDVFLGDDNSLPHLAEIRDLALESTIAVMTAGSRDEALDDTLNAARQANVDYILRKPFSRRQLRGIVRSAEEDLLSGKRRRHALVIDDSAVVAKLTAQILSDNGYRTSVAHTMEEALTSGDIAHVDLVICDIFMPGMGGLEGIRVIKAAWPKVKVIAMSAGLDERVSSQRAISAAVKAGADGEILKPFTATQFMDLIVELTSV